MNDIIVDKSLMIYDTCIRMGGVSDNTSLRPLFWKPVMEVLITYQIYK